MTRDICILFLLENEKSPQALSFKNKNKKINTRKRRRRRSPQALRCEYYVLMFFIRDQHSGINELVGLIGNVLK